VGAKAIAYTFVKALAVRIGCNDALALLGGAFSKLCASFSLLAVRAFHRDALALLYGAPSILGTRRRLRTILPVLCNASPVERGAITDAATTLRLPAVFIRTHHALAIQCCTCSTFLALFLFHAGRVWIEYGYRFSPGGLASLSDTAKAAGTFVIAVTIGTIALVFLASKEHGYK